MLRRKGYEGLRDCFGPQDPSTEDPHKNASLGLQLWICGYLILEFTLQSSVFRCDQRERIPDGIQVICFQWSRQQGEELAAKRDPQLFPRGCYLLQKSSIGDSKMVIQAHTHLS